jgi:integrase
VGLYQQRTESDRSSEFHSRVWRKLLAKAGLRYIRVHDLRHTFASLLIQNGESLAYVEEQMGHHSITIMVDTYGHLFQGATRRQWTGWMGSKTQPSVPYPQPRF